MAEPAKAAVELKEFPGLMTEVDPHDAPPGAGVIQVNATGVKAAELLVRSGYREVSFEDT